MRATAIGSLTDIANLLASVNTTAGTVLAVLQLAQGLYNQFAPKTERVSDAHIIDIMQLAFKANQEGKPIPPLNETGE